MANFVMIIIAPTIIMMMNGSAVAFFSVNSTRIFNDSKSRRVKPLRGDKKYKRFLSVIELMSQCFSDDVIALSSLNRCMRFRQTPLSQALCFLRV
jgi:hypothetical protein